MIKIKSAWNKGLKGYYHSGSFQKGHKSFLTEESKNKISKALIGRFMSEETKNKIGNANRGKKFSEQHRQKLSESHKGQKPYEMTDEIRKNISNGQKGRKHTIETKRKLSESHKGKIGYWLGKKRINISGKNNPFWKGGITPINNKIRNSIEFRLWREAVFARDNWTDQKTGIKGGRLVAHHIQNFAQYPELRLAIDNGITLSEKAHKEFHKKYGVKNNTKEQLEEFLNER